MSVVRKFLVGDVLIDCMCITRVFPIRMFSKITCELSRDVLGRECSQRTISHSWNVPSREYLSHSKDLLVKDISRECMSHIKDVPNREYLHK